VDAVEETRDVGDGLVESKSCVVDVFIAFFDEFS